MVRRMNLLGSQTWHNPLELRIGSPSSFTLIRETGYTDGIILEQKPIAPNLLSMFTEKYTFFNAPMLIILYF